MTTSAPASGDICAQASAIGARLQAVTSPATQAQIAQSLAFAIAEETANLQAAFTAADATIPPGDGNTRAWIQTYQPQFLECDRASRFAVSQIGIVVTVPPNTALLNQVLAAFSVAPPSSAAAPLQFGVTSASFSALQSRVSAAQALCAQSGAVCIGQGNSPAGISTWVGTAYAAAQAAYNSPPTDAGIALLPPAMNALTAAMAAGSQFLAASSFQ